MKQFVELFSGGSPGINRTIAGSKLVAILEEEGDLEGFLLLGDQATGGEWDEDEGLRDAE